MTETPGHGDALDYEQTLRELHGLVGREVWVGAYDTGGLMMGAAGVLRRAEVAPRALEGEEVLADEAVSFYMAREGETEAELFFLVARENHQGARWADQDGHRALRIMRPGGQLSVIEMSDSGAVG